ncbi:MAG: hypothetical protein KQJ78_18080 [Deltaproteobacteria bacterium]|nr:hypothetical protein [Deltaproteobacteria bacterium]
MAPRATRAPRKACFWNTLLCLCFLALLISPPAGLAADGDGALATADPMIRITSLPLKGDLSQLMARISDDVCRDTGLKKNLATYFWQTFNAIYCPGCAAAKLKGPIFVDIYLPAFISVPERKKLMTSLAEALARHTDYTTKDVYIAIRVQEKGEVYIMGEVLSNWQQVGGPDQ